MTVATGAVVRREGVTVKMGVTVRMKGRGKSLILYLATAWQNRATSSFTFVGSCELLGE